MLMNMILDNALKVGLGPALVTLVAALIAWRPWSDTRETAGGLWAGPVGLAGAFLTGLIMINGWPEWTPSASGGWLVHVTLGAAVLGLAESLYRRDSRFFPTLKIIVLGGGLYMVIQFMFTNYWKTFPVQAAYMAGIVGLAMLSMRTLETMARRHPGATMPLVLHIMAAGAALAITFAHSASTGQQLGTLATATAVFAAVSWWKGAGRLSLARGGVTVFVTILTLKLAIGYFNAIDPNIYATITTPAIVASPLVLWIGESPPISNLTGWRATAARVALMGSGVAVIVAVAYLGW